MNWARWSTAIVETTLERGVDQAVQAPHLLLLGQHGDIVLEGVRNPLTLVPDARDALVRAPVGGLWQRLVETVVKVLVVGEDDMPTHVEPLWEGKEKILVRGQ